MSLRVLTGSALAGLASTAFLVAAPFAGGGEAAATGAVLLGAAVTCALLARLAAGWARVPAIALGIAGAALVVAAPAERVLDALGWLWPPLLLALVAWVAVRSRSRRLAPVLAAVALTAVGCGFEAVAGGDEVRGGRLVDVGGHRLHLTCTGTGRPAVVLEPGLGESARAMARRIAPQVAPMTRVCAYDRAGHGRSDAAPGADAAQDLHALLRRAGLGGPVVLAGHSLGGALAIDHAGRFPSDVAGVVLLDAMHPEQAGTAADLGGLLDLVPLLARTGLGRLLLDPADGDPVDQARQFVRDVEAMPAQLDRAAAVRTLGELPLGVLSAGRGTQRRWAPGQRRLAALSRRAFHRTAAGATHASLVDGDAAVSARAIRDVVAAVRRAG